MLKCRVARLEGRWEVHAFPQWSRSHGEAWLFERMPCLEYIEQGAYRVKAWQGKNGLFLTLSCSPSPSLQANLGVGLSEQSIQTALAHAMLLHKEGLGKGKQVGAER